MLWFIGISLFFFAVFLMAYKINRTSLAPSFMLTISLFFAMGGLFLSFDYSQLYVTKILFVALFFLFLIIFAFGLYALIGFLLFNAAIVFKKEKRTLANFLTLILAVSIIAYLFLTHLIDDADLPEIVRMIRTGIQFLIFCYMVHATHYMIATLLCNLSRPSKNQDYIVVHGAGLINGKVTPLLAGRIDKAIKFYTMQKKRGEPPKIIFSGGQGNDEPRPESEAMAEYALEKGFPEDHVLLESRSTTTLENMRFSKQIMDEDAKGKAYRAIYVTSNYHLLRTGIYARKAGLKMRGIGSKTALYYLPNALLREYIAYFFLHRKQNIAFIILSLLLSCGAGPLIAMLDRFL